MTPIKDIQAHNALGHATAGMTLTYIRHPLGRIVESLE